MIKSCNNHTVKSHLQSGTKTEAVKSLRQLSTSSGLSCISSSLAFGLWHFFLIKIDLIWEVKSMHHAAAINQHFHF